MKCFGAVGALMLTDATQAAGWPTKPAKIVIAVGGANDLLVRCSLNG